MSRNKLFMKVISALVLLRLKRVMRNRPGGNNKLRFTQLLCDFEEI